MPAKKHPTLIDLRKHLLLQVDGEDEKDHTIDWDKLKSIGDATQNLILKLAKYSLEDPPNPEALKLTFLGLHAGSAIPDWQLPDPGLTLYNTDKFYKKLNKDFSSIVYSIEEGNFKQIANSYSEPVVRNEIINAVYAFSNSAGTTPLRVVRKAPPSAKTKFISVAQVRPMSPKIKSLLHVDELGSFSKITTVDEIDAVGKFKLKTSKAGRKTKKDVHLYTEKEAVLSLIYYSIESEKRVYNLNTEVTFIIVEDKKNHVVIENKLLDIYAFGKNINEAKENVFDQFDFTYQRLNQVEDKNLSAHLLSAKKYLALLVGNVKDK